MAVDKVENLLGSIRKAFSKRDSKEEELKADIEKAEKEVREITERIDEISYKALIEEEATAFKEYQALKKEEADKIAKFELAKERLRALDKFEIGIDTRQQALDIHKGIKADIEAKTKVLDSKTKEYYKAKLELEKKAREIQDLHKEIGLLPLDLKEVAEFIEPKDINKTEEELNSFIENINREDERKRFFEMDMFKNRDKGLSREDISQVLNGTIYIKPHRTR